MGLLEEAQSKKARARLCPSTRAGCAGSLDEFLGEEKRHSRA